MTDPATVEVVYAALSSLPDHYSIEVDRIADRMLELVAQARAERDAHYAPLVDAAEWLVAGGYAAQAIADALTALSQEADHG